MTIKNVKDSRAIKANGRAWENAVKELFKSRGFTDAERRRQRGTKDAGDLSGISGLMVECKDEKSISLAQYMKEVADQPDFDYDELGIAAVKRRKKGVEDGYAVVPLGWFATHWAAYIQIRNMTKLLESKKIP